MSYLRRRVEYLLEQLSQGRLRFAEIFPDDFVLDLPMPSWMDSWLDRDQLGRFVAGLNPSHREALLLHHVWGFSFKEIDGILGIRETTAKVRGRGGRLAG